MNIKNINISNLFQKGVESGPKEFRTIGEKARHDWKIMTSLFLFGLCCVTALSASAFFRVGGEITHDIPQVVANSDQVDVELITSIVDHYASRGSDLAQGLPESPVGPDPSL